MNDLSLLRKYDVPVPRYTSYPTVPDWNTEVFQIEDYRERLLQAFASYKEDGLSLYIHLPFCESLCTYCGCNTRITVNHAVEKPYIEGLLKEWSMYLHILPDRPILKELHLGGGTPTFFSPEHLKLLLEALLKTVVLHPDFEFSFEGHPANTTYAHLKVLRELGFSRVSFGIQDFDPKVQLAINRLQSFEQVCDVTRWSRELGYGSVNFDLIYGLPFQTRKSIEHTIEKVAELMPDRIAFYSYAHVPWKRPGQRAYSEKDLPSAYEKQQLNQFGHRQLLALGYELVGMDHFALPEDELLKAMKNGRLHRNFMGYTTNPGKLLMGLGVSSISDIHLAYAQNVKSVEGYLSQLNAGKLPLFKGHLMTSDDLNIKSKILQVACQKSFKEDALPKQSKKLLDELMADGLLVSKGEGYEISQSGNQFLRNVCALFDPHYHSTTKKERVFSQSV
ncbi:oxygen-independent coproporphyrinogen III oxidase [Roseivirga sp. UBA838]|uniref:oxygen-independent coproporphyrinogen III oxidase n=1 Tax=Roseivirga sp. UBA838 TaxID=1947393 RepID=UPI00257B986F|nr:oxygen-independent coproporphyrinogen III oxidase [Roseivirga sp. UBA838]|tara:strand:+ start:11292 stop:12635 length:1344 start_codon:yes stop_codon:yes gene_type:complete